jgi:hypothetical protein
MYAQRETHFLQHVAVFIDPGFVETMPTVTPYFANTFSGATPLRKRRFELQLWQMQVPVCATISMSSSVSHTPWPSVSDGPSKPRSFRCATAVLPVRRRAYSFWYAP